MGGRFSIIFLVPEIITANEISVAPRILKHPGICCKEIQIYVIENVSYKELD